MSKLHLKESEEPLMPGFNHTAMCGEIVPKALFVFHFDDSCEMNFSEFLSSIRICRWCRKIEEQIEMERQKLEPNDPGKTRRYVYALSPGQEEMDLEREQELVEAA